MHNRKLIKREGTVSEILRLSTRVAFPEYKQFEEGKLLCFLHNVKNTGSLPWNFHCLNFTMKCLSVFRMLCKHDLVEQYNIVDPLVVERLLKAVRRAKEEDTDDDVSTVEC